MQIYPKKKKALNRSDRVAQLKQLLAAEPDDVFLKYALALEFAKTNDVHQAVVLLEEIRSADPLYKAVYYQLGMLYNALNETGKAREAVEQGLAVTKNTDQKTHNELRGLLDEIE